MQFRLSVAVLLTFALSALASPVPSDDLATRNPEAEAMDTLLERGICTCLCEPCRGRCRLCESGV
ncbi:hypothetical protein B0T09DRAFT_343225 [Sordaria sp. MPI-SDFR-AT-0083]|nr:hypothetical protein B0T09DRAFT_343225 [Sordaria sp. MPI-SDFR-AT-0083]